MSKGIHKRFFSNIWYCQIDAFAQMRWCAALKANIVWNIIKIIPLSWINRTILLSLSTTKRKYWNNKILSDAKNK